VDKSASFCGNAPPRRSTWSLDPNGRRGFVLRSPPRGNPRLHSCWPHRALGSTTASYDGEGPGTAGNVRRSISEGAIFSRDDRSSHTMAPNRRHRIRSLLRIRWAHYRNWMEVVLLRFLFWAAPPSRLDLSKDRAESAQAIAKVSATSILSCCACSNNRFERSAGSSSGEPRRRSTMWINQLRFSTTRPRVAQPNC